MRTTIEVFAIQIKNIDGFLDFSDDPDLFAILSDTENGFVKYIDTHSTGDIPTLHRTVRIPKSEVTDEDDMVKYYHKNNEGRYICGIIETGAYGKEYDVADKDDPKRPSFTVSKDQAIIKPFFYYLKIPRKGTKALLILERTENEGIYPMMNLMLIGFLSKTFGVEQLFKIDKTNVILGSYLDELKNSRYKSVTLTANKLSTDMSERYFGKLEVQDFTLELTFKFKNKIGEDKERAIREMINSGQVLLDTPSLNDIFDADNPKVVATTGTGKQARNRTYYMGKNVDSIRPYYDIVVEANDKNFSDYRSIKEVVKKFVAETPDFNVFK